MFRQNLTYCRDLYGVMYYLADATATFFKMMEPVETVKF